MSRKFLKRTKIILLSLSGIATLVFIITQVQWAGWTACFTFVTWFMLFKMKPEVQSIPEPTEYSAFFEELSEDYCRN